jgi:hypothetical protein
VTHRLRIETDDVAVRHVQRERWRGRLLLLACWAGGVGVMAAVQGGALCLAPPVMLLGTALLLGRSHGAPIAGVRAAGDDGVLVFDDEGVTLSRGRGRERFARGEIAAGWVERFREGDDDVVLQMRSGTILRFRAADQAQVRAALKAAGVAPEDRAVTLRLGVAEESGARVVMIFLAEIVAALALAVLAVFGAMFGTANHHPGLPELSLMGIAAALAGFGLYVLFRPLVTATLRIGTDGVVVERLLRKRFLPRARVTGAEAAGNEISLGVTGGEGVRLTVSSANEAAIVVQRVNEALADRGDVVGAGLRAQLDRQGRPVAAWLRGVRALAQGDAGYRHLRVDRDALAALLDDGAATAEHRIAAAAALASDEGGKRRVRVAAEACADDRLRLALEEAGEAEQTAAIEEALRERR